MKPPISSRATALVMIFAAIMAAGCNTLMVPVAMSCPVPSEYLKACDDYTALTSKERTNALAKAGDEGVLALHLTHDHYYLGLSDSSRMCGERHLALSKMVAACNQNAEDMRPKIHKVISTN
ncbi:hypothetical protein ACFJGX_20975 [Hydrogenophaga sp. UC242_50]|jgi:predicted small secreted protein|uniref:hypothetical protein n=1 Tax=unclassified Hydrogenophaga TaxID=2610897 RepID=UPI0036D209DA